MCQRLLSILLCTNSLSLITTPCEWWYHHPHFTDKKTEAEVELHAGGGGKPSARILCCPSPSSWCLPSPASLRAGPCLTVLTSPEPRESWELRPVCQTKPNQQSCPITTRVSTLCAWLPFLLLSACSQDPPARRGRQKARRKETFAFTDNC